MSVRNLHHLFNPRSVALIGGSDSKDSVGHVVLSNIIEGGFEGEISVVNPKPVHHKKVTWVARVDELPKVPDLAVVMTPAKTIPLIIKQLGAMGTKVCVVISSAKTDGEDMRLPIIHAACPYLLRVIGPNCLGVMMPHAKLQASFARTKAKPGGLAFISQSGALVTAMLDWAESRNVGFSAIVSAGDMADVDLGDLIDMFAADPKTDAILLYVEGVTHAAKFMSAARAAARIKPVIAIKGGKGAAARKATMSHTGALAGSYDVYRAAFDKAGIVTVETLSELFDAAEILCQPHVMSGDRLAIITNGGGAGILAVDGLEMLRERVGGKLATLTGASIQKLNSVLPSSWSRGNPVDVIGDAGAERYRDALNVVARDPNVDAILVMNCPTALSTPREISQAVVDTSAALMRDGIRKPILACWLGNSNCAAARSIFQAANIPLFDIPYDAVRAFDYLRDAQRARIALLDSSPLKYAVTGDKVAATKIIEQVRDAGRTVLNEIEAKALLEAYHIPTVPTHLAKTPDDVVAVCKGIEPPYVVKIVSPQITHKSDVGGVALNLPDATAAQAVAKAMQVRIAREHPTATITGFAVESMYARPHAHELIVGISDDVSFGPVLMVGAGGKAVEVLHDRALALPPLTDQMARAMINRTRISALLAGYRDEPPADVDGVVAVLEALSNMVSDLPDILELDINPLLVDPHGAVALDARIRITPHSEPKSRMVIRPAPMHWAASLKTRSGMRIHVRPVRPDDEGALAEFFTHVSPEDLRFRFFSGIRTVSHDMIAQMTQVDYQRTVTFLAFADDGETVVATAMLASDPDRERAELALCTRLDMKQRGVSWVLLEHVLKYAKAEGIKRVESIEWADHKEAIVMEQEMGFVSHADPDDATLRIVSRTL